MEVYEMVDLWGYVDTDVIEDYRIKGGMVEWHY